MKRKTSVSSFLRFGTGLPQAYKIVETGIRCMYGGMVGGGEVGGGDGGGWQREGCVV